jgi:hypothetical protein
MADEIHEATTSTTVYPYDPTPRWRLHRWLWRRWRTVRGRCCHPSIGQVVLVADLRAWRCGQCGALTSLPRMPHPWEVRVHV